MTNFEKVYSFNVLDEIVAGKKVFVLDREEALVECVNEMTVARLAEVFKLKESNIERFEYWFNDYETTEEKEE